MSEFFSIFLFAPLVGLFIAFPVIDTYKNWFPTKEDPRLATLKKIFQPHTYEGIWAYQKNHQDLFMDKTLSILSTYLDQFPERSTLAENDSLTFYHLRKTLELSYLYYYMSLDRKENEDIVFHFQPSLNKCTDVLLDYIERDTIPPMKVLDELNQFLDAFVDQMKERDKEDERREFLEKQRIEQLEQEKVADLLEEEKMVLSELKLLKNEK